MLFCILSLILTANNPVEWFKDVKIMADITDENFLDGQDGRQMTSLTKLADHLKPAKTISDRLRLANHLRLV